MNFRQNKLWFSRECWPQWNITKPRTSYTSKTFWTIRNYITLEKTIFGDAYNQEFHVKVGSISEEIKALLEVGYEHVCANDGRLFFRKRK